MLALKILLIMVSAIAKALADTIVFHDGGKFTKIKNFKNRFQGKYLKILWFKTKYKWDYKHISNTVMIWCFIGASVMEPVKDVWYYQVAEFTLLGIIFIITFNMFWNRVFNY